MVRWWWAEVSERMRPVGMRGDLPPSNGHFSHAVLIHDTLMACITLTSSPTPPQDSAHSSSWSRLFEVMMTPAFASS